MAKTSNPSHPLQRHPQISSNCRLLITKHRCDTNCANCSSTGCKHTDTLLWARGHVLFWKYLGEKSKKVHMCTPWVTSRKANVKPKHPSQELPQHFEKPVTKPVRTIICKHYYPKLSFHSTDYDSSFKGRRMKTGKARKLKQMGVSDHCKRHIGER